MNPENSLTVAIADEPGELWQVVEVLVAQHAEHRVERSRRGTDVDHDAVVVELGPPEGRVHHEGGAVQPLGRSEDLAGQAVRHHHVVADGHGVHVTGSRRR